MRGEILVGAVDAGLVAARRRDAGLEVVAHHRAGNAADGVEGVDVRADPLRQRLAPAGLGVGVIGRPQHRDEDVSASLLTGRGVEHRHRVAGPIDEQLLAGSMRLPHRRRDRLQPIPIELAEVTVSGAFIKGVDYNLTEAQITFDKFHAVKLVNDAVDKVRRAESKDRPELKRSRYLWLKNERHLSAEQSASLAALSSMHLKTARAYRLRLAFQDIYDQPSPGWGELILDRWYSWAVRSRLEPMKDAARTIMRHRDGILRWFTSKIANGLIEGINSLVQAAKAKARGYRSTRNLKAITYLIAGKLDLRLPT